MPEALTWEDPRGRPVRNIGDTEDSNTAEFALPAFNNVVRGISSPVLEVVVRNLSTTHRFVGQLITAPVSGLSYANDIQLSIPGQVWDNNIPVDIPPNGSLAYFVRILPISTPPDAVGRGAVKAAGKFELVSVEA